MTRSTRSSFDSDFSLSSDSESQCRQTCRPRSPIQTLKYLSFLTLSLSLIFYLTHTTASPAPSPPFLPSTPFQASNPSPQDTKFPSKIGKATASFGPHDPTYEAAISSHHPHDALHGYPHFILRERMLPGLWSKHAFLLTLIGTELSKPADHRLHWIFWHDRDTILMNPNIPLEIFLPAQQKEVGRNKTGSDVNLIVTNDRHGLNNGVFFLRVGEWAVRFLSASLSLKEWDANVQLKYSEQSAMEIVGERPHFSQNIFHVPQRWFNAYPPPSTTTTTTTTTTTSAPVAAPSAARKGSLLIHFASNRDGKRPERMAQWQRVAGSPGNEWNKPLNETRYVSEIAEFWERLGEGEEEGVVVSDIGGRTWD
ncbi:glycosyltransferase family 34 protein [Bipolaris oryzae ATCC 44560]|uniref:Glycosyltransferase family 34 protein n=1 Tax=Bipolaris oryzae ATCC 44560 TaxID=930090 RepID=W6YYT2_COCMI|nr:glycosyltransferase family 34 protein [Bipolaris oryzae ATCC 44560]EUC42720.1 glycosyltransferase family 34 protein [Bipolaris oryzae ATCC 44560]